MSLLPQGPGEINYRDCEIDCDNNEKSASSLQNRSLPLIKILSLIRLNREICFYSISKKYPKVTASSLQKVNGLSSPDIRPVKY